MESKGKRESLIKSFGYAFSGIVHTYQTERNIRIHSGVTFFVIIFGFFMKLSRIEWSIICLTIGITFSLELVNTALERVVDLVTTEHQPLAKFAKDVAAGAVLLFSGISVIIGILIFAPYIMQWTK